MCNSYRIKPKRGAAKDLHEKISAMSLGSSLVRKSDPGVVVTADLRVEVMRSPSLGVTEMLLQSPEGVIRFFPCWSRDCGNARFGTLRANGAFLVSAELKGGVVSGVKITSEKGCDSTIQNPWPDKTVRVIPNGNRRKPSPARVLPSKPLSVKTSS
jgi:hypothetical protein